MKRLVAACALALALLASSAPGSAANAATTEGIAGTVTANGTPLQGATVSAWRVKDGDLDVTREFRTQTDKYGRYTISHLTPGSYKVFFYAGYKSGLLDQWWDSLLIHAFRWSGSDEADALTVVAGQTTTANASLQRPSSITGRVTADGVGLPNVSVNLTWTEKPGKRAKQITGVVWTDSDGRFRIEDLPGGNFVLTLYTDHAPGSWSWRPWEEITFDLGQGETHHAEIAVTGDLPPEPKHPSEEDGLLRATNEARAKGQQCGETYYPPAPPVVLDRRLMSAARLHSLDMATYNYLSHWTPSGVWPTDRMKAAGWYMRYGDSPFNGWGENAQVGFIEPTGAVKGWLGSPGHCANLMNPRHTHMGVGFAAAQDQNWLITFGYWTQVFGRLDPAEDALPPMPPTEVTATGQPGKVHVAWIPGDANGSLIEGYRVTATPGNKTCTTDGVLACSISGLEAQTSYRFSVTATNTHGTSKASVLSNAVKPLQPGQPRAPRHVQAVAGRGTATVSWVEPRDDGGSPITGYSVTATPGGKTCTTSGVPSCTISGLVNGTAHTFTATATNRLGTSALSAASRPVTPLTVPGAPTNVRVDDTYESGLKVWWSAPESDGGTPITGYTVTATQKSSGTPSSSVTACETFRDETSCEGVWLDNGTYTLTVRAENKVGSGPDSATSSEAIVDHSVPSKPDPEDPPVTTPGPVRGLTITASAKTKRATARWLAPRLAKGEKVTTYYARITYGNSTRWRNWKKTSNRVRSYPIRPGRRYSIQVRAKTTFGLSATKTRKVSRLRVRAVPAVRLAPPVRQAFVSGAPIRWGSRK